MLKRQHSTKVPKSMQPYYQSVTELTDNFCQKQLNMVYHVLARYATAALCRKKQNKFATCLKCIGLIIIGVCRVRLKTLLLPG